MEPCPVSVREKLAWEKELTGVYLSEHPFSPYAGRTAVDNTTLCGQIDAEMEGQTVRVAGMVASMRAILTRDGQTSLSAVLEDLEGKIEVMVWARVYNQTKDLWQEGSILLVEGKVRERADQIQIVCDRVSRYDIDTGAAGVSAAPKSTAMMVANSPGQGKEAAVAAAGELKPRELQRLFINMHQSADADADVARLHHIMQILKEYPGNDEVALSVANGTRVFKLKMGQVRVECCRELAERLAAIVGEDGVHIENLVKDKKNGHAIP